MADPREPRIWLARGTFLALCLFLIFFQLLPLSTLPPRWAPPDLILCLTLAWVARRPDYVPVLSVALVFLLCDFLFMRPPGLMTALVLILTETLRARHHALRNAGFWVEWGNVALGIVIVTFLARLTASLSLIELPPLWLVMTQMVLTIVIYPALAFASQFLFHVSRPRPGEVDGLGHRL